MTKNQLQQLYELDIIDTKCKAQINSLLDLEDAEIDLLLNNKECAKYYFYIVNVLKENPDYDF